MPVCTGPFMVINFAWSLTDTRIPDITNISGVEAKQYLCTSSGDLLVIMNRIHNEQTKLDPLAPKKYNVLQSVQSLWSIESESTDLPTLVLQVALARNQWIHAALLQTVFVRF